MTKLLKNLLISLFFLAFILNPFKSNALENTYCRDISCNKAACDLRISERKVWIDHVTWTRSFIVSDLASLDDKSDVLERLLKNQEDIGNSIKSYYGEEAGNKLTTL